MIELQLTSKEKEHIKRILIAGKWHWEHNTDAMKALEKLMKYVRVIDDA